MMVCSRCNKAKALDCFAPEKKRCVECSEYSRAYRESHRPQLRESGLVRYYQLMESDPERIRANRRNAAKTPRGIIANRAARHRRRGAPLTPEAKSWWLSLVDPICHYCPEPATEIDHVVPISRGGTGDLSNLVPACRTCNARKSDSAEWGQSAGAALTLAS